MSFPPLGALPEPGGVRFNVWAPKAQAVHLVLENTLESIELTPGDHGLFTGFVPRASAGTHYRYSLDHGDPFPDPASRFQPEGVHGPSEVIDPHAFAWHDAGWTPPAQRDLVFYELHVGTFTPEGTFEALRQRLPELADLGITAIELMPVADFPGRWNWGYDHAALYAPSRAYGHPDDLRRLVDDAHALGLAVVLDVIYNHLGPDGAYVAAFAPMFTDKHHTPWGQAINLDDVHSDGVRHLFLDNALHWLREYHLDGLRLDATHAIIDDSEPHFLAELAAAVHALPGPRRILFAEEHRNLNYFVLPRPRGYGLDGVWADDFHHQIRNLIAGDEEHYFANFAGTTMHDLAATIRQGWFYTGQVAVETGKPRGTDPSEVQPWQCVVCIQNHDQVGNRPLGNRLSDDTTPEAFRAASALLLFVPELPLLFMGQEWAANTPFQFFTDHNPDLGKLVSEGRKKEFEQFAGFAREEVPDPQDESTFTRSRLDWDEPARMPHLGVRRLYRDLLRLRRTLPDETEAEALSDAVLHVRRGPYHLVVSADAAEVPLPEGAEVVLHTEQDAYAEAPAAPEIAEGRVRFRRAGALICRT